MMFDFDESLKLASWAADFSQHLAREDVEQALPVATKALEQGDARGKAVAYSAIARAHLLEREFLKAVEAAQKGVQAAQGDAVAMAERTAAKAYLAVFRLDEAAEAADKAVSAAQGPAQAAALTTRAQVCLARDKKQEAAKVARQAAALFKEQKEQQGEAAALEVLVRACLATKKGGDALRAANEVLAIYQGSASANEARGLLLVAKTKQALGDSQEAQELAQNAVDIFDKNGDRLMQGIMLKQLADICLAGGENIDGWQYTRAALECFRDVGHKRGEAATLCQIAAAHVETGVLEEALRIADEGVEICRQRNDRPQLGATLNVIASAHVGQLRLARSDQQEQQTNWKARLAGKEAMAVLQSVGDRVGEAQALKSLATAFLNYGNAAEARAKAKLAIEIAKEVGNKQIEGENLLLVAQTKIHENKEEGARLARMSEKLLREAGASSAARNAGDVYDFIRDYGAAPKESKKDKPKMEADTKTDITVDVEENKHRLSYFHGFTARSVRPRA
ncbi:unnamed protein product [Effrenium voratum]|uniref:MalT-like TPR region domain-containing protein n=1 Tax=Effrenium voratum TaxID=2562239 RepID=A0AA36MMW4_9DINO|nr:unnamed protein product [Effrenium voratum]CAJ1378569.1 unnamed protein product [Effrenium voratum]CAJ1447619.1 unnamed protein product [Effrenium voratum]CAJ1459495.1 unnamed protein product [Effrenium voratum]|mmetsp:Transcript_101124/g.241030  ORF Transcript_101124/g.241030 Transcript_101124/m.241030 type:complete len:509 (+) Transcript_101124:82-1608(+)